MIWRASWSERKGESDSEERICPVNAKWWVASAQLSPLGESWAERATEALPANVTVEFENCDTGFLDMRIARAAHWARRIDKLQKAKQPVYVEIDNETGVITTHDRAKHPRMVRLDQAANNCHFQRRD